ncbi:MAG: shikimate kinase [Lachnospiraceae bacterium]
MKELEQDQKRSYNIVLIGFMGTGKSAVAHYLHKTYGMDVIEMDQLIEQQEGISIPEMFHTYGEEYFRNLETRVLTELQEQNNYVISCGGGAVLREENIKAMKKNGRVVLLVAEPSTILERVKGTNHRPLLEGKQNIAFITKFMEQRFESYEAAADVVIHTDGKNVRDIGEELIAKL